MHLDSPDQIGPLAIVHGPRNKPLLQYNLGQLLEKQAKTYPEREAIVTSWTNTKLSYEKLYGRSKIIARALLACDLDPGDRIGILSGNCERYIELFFGASLIGVVVVVLNITYTPIECRNALQHSVCRALFISEHIGRRDMGPHLDLIQSSISNNADVLSDLQQITLIRGLYDKGVNISSYTSFECRGDRIPHEKLHCRMAQVAPYDICNIQFTSGTTSLPKAAMLTHNNIVNNAQFIGDQMHLTPQDSICCPPPLFHCFGLVLGLLACITHGATLVLPSQTFEPVAVLNSLMEEQCTGLHGVPTMFVAVLEEHRRRQNGPIRLRTGIAAGSPVPQTLMEELQDEFGLEDLTITYGMTETSPASFMTSVDDDIEDKLSTVGRILPHTSAKIIASDGTILPYGHEGELCVSGYCLQKGYFNDPERTREAMIEDETGVVWMHTGDEATIDERGFCKITGRIKDIIIRGGENIHPREIEDRLSEHCEILQAAVVGVKDAKYGETVAAFLQRELKPVGGSTVRPSDEEIQLWVGNTLGRHKIPIHIFWLGDKGVGDSFPVTGSGKLRKNELRDIGNSLVQSGGNFPEKEIIPIPVEANSYPRDLLARSVSALCTGHSCKSTDVGKHFCPLRSLHATASTPNQWGSLRPDKTSQRVVDGVITTKMMDSNMPIAIVGMSCRFPGDATSPEKLWEMCKDGRSAWSEIPSDRFNARAFNHPDSHKQGTTNTKGAHFLKEDISFFDAPFFNITLEEAKAMDPQLRLQLECTYEALENAGLTFDKLANSPTSVYSGVFGRDYHDGLIRDVQTLPRYFNTGNGAAMLSNRISYFFDLKGPSLTVDTGCSTSLVALHLGCQSVRAGESKMSIVGASNLIFRPDMTTAMTNFGFLSPDGKSYSFDHRANGYGRGEGVASIIIRPLQDALRDGDPVRAIIRDSGLNQDGKTAGITLPSPEAQEALIRECYERTGLDPRETGYVEAHGTGTVGDQLETSAISKIFSKGRDPNDPVLVGSVKTNIGHTEATSGLAGVIKAVLAIEKGTIPPSINFEKGHTKIPFQEWKIKIPTTLEPWPLHKLRRASVNSFGYGGTNGHVILEHLDRGGLTNGAISNGHTVNGDAITDGTEFGAEYWVRNMVQPVLFVDSLRGMCLDMTHESRKVDILVEVGPHSGLAGPIRQIFALPDMKGLSIPYTSCLVRKNDAVKTMQEMAGALLVSGYPVDLPTVNRLSGHLEVLKDLPPYPWTHKVKHWHESRLSKEHRLRQHGPHDLLGLPSDDINSKNPRWRHIIRPSEIPWVRDHVIQSDIIYPGAGYISMAVEAMKQISADEGDNIAGYKLRDVHIISAVIVPDSSDGVELQLTFAPCGNRLPGAQTWTEFHIYSVVQDSWTEHCTGFISVEYKSSTEASDWNHVGSVRSLEGDFLTASRNCLRNVSPKDVYEELHSVGINHGPIFQGLDEIHVGDTQSFATVTISDTASVMPMNFESDHVVHPTTLDSIFQAIYPIDSGGKTAMVPKSFDNIFISNTITDVPGSRLKVVSTAAKTTSQSLRASILVANESDPQSLSAIEINGLVCGAIGQTTENDTEDVRRLCFQMQWIPSTSREPASGPDGAVSNGNVIAEHTADGNYPQISILYKDWTSSESLIEDLRSKLTTMTGQAPKIDKWDHAPDKHEACICLLELEKPILDHISEAEFGALRTLLTTSKAVLWLTRGGAIECQTPSASLVTGFFRTLRNEISGTRFVSLDVGHNVSNQTTVNAIGTVVKETFDLTTEEKLDLEYALREEGLMVPRVIEDGARNMTIASDGQDPTPELQPFYQTGRPLRMEIGTRGLLDSLHFVDDTSVEEALPDDFIEIEPKAFGLNFRDIMVAMGQLNETVMGYECSGIVTRVGRSVSNLRPGDKVAGLTRGHYANYLRLPAVNAVRMLPDMTFETGASLPIVFSTAYYSLYEAARLRKGDTVLIHAATGGVGQAAIMLAQLTGAEIFATAGTLEKRQFLIDTYNLPADHIFSSRTTSFAKAIKSATGGRGVDIVLNSLAGEMLHESWNCIAPLGRFVEIGKRDFELNNHLEMKPFTRNVAFFSIDLTYLMNDKTNILTRILENVMRLFDSHKIRAVEPITVYPISEVEKAFRLMQSGKHRGKVVIKPDAGDMIKAIPVKRSVQFHPDASYLIVGGTGGIGRSITKWMAEQGAKNLIILSRSGATGPQAQNLLTELSELGCHCVIEACDIADESRLKSVLLKNAKIMPPVRGVIQAAMDLKDCVFEQMPYSSFTAALRPKVQGTWNLNSLLPKDNLDFFIMLSSAAGIGGNGGQSNYAAGSTYLDALARYRTSLGLPAVSIDLGVIESVGYVSENQDLSARLARQGHMTIRQGELLKLIEDAILNPRRDLDASQIVTGLAVGSNNAPWLQDMKFSQLQQAIGGDTDKATSLQTQLGAAKTSSEVVELIVKAIAVKLSQDFMIPETDIDPSQPVSAYGVDSLVAVELRNWILRQAKAEVSIFDVLQSKSFTSLAEKVANRSSYVDTSIKNSP